MSSDLESKHVFSNSSPVGMVEHAEQILTGLLNIHLLTMTSWYAFE